MEKIIRKGIAFDPSELESFDRKIKKRGYKNRSEAIRDLVRDAIVEDRSSDPQKNMMGTLTMVYNHHDHDVQHNLTHKQHHHPSLIISSMHTHMDHDNCLEILVLKGKVKDIKRLSEDILSTKGVVHGKLVLTDIG